MYTIVNLTVNDIFTIQDYILENVYYIPVSNCNKGLLFLFKPMYILLALSCLVPNGVSRVQADSDSVSDSRRQECHLDLNGMGHSSSR